MPSEVDDEERERLWKHGIHVDADGNRRMLTDMDSDYLRNVIKMFDERLDTTPLLKALRDSSLDQVPEVLSYLEYEQALQNRKGSKEARKLAKLAKEAREALKKFYDEI